MNEEFRIDAEYFQKRFLNEDQHRAKFENIPIGRLAFVTDGQHGYHEVDETSPIWHLTAKNAKGWIADTDGADHIAKWVDDNNQRSSLQVNDVILSTRGTVGSCALVTAAVLPANIDQDVARIALKTNAKVSPAFLLAYLNSQFGQDWLQRNASGMVQQGLSLDKVRNIPVPIVSENFQEAVENAIRSAQRMFEQSHKLNVETENLLFNALGLGEWKPDDTSVCTSSASAVQSSGRFDAEYFRPRYQSLLALLRRQGKTLRDVARLRENMFTPQPGQPFHYIEIGDLAADGAATSHVVPGEEAPSRATWIVQPGDVITSTVRPNRCLTGLIEPEQAGNICSSGFAVLTPKGIPGELLLAYLRLPVICELMDLHTTASMSPAISTTDRMRLPFLLPDDATIKKVKQQITAARAARREAHALLEKAKQAVEVAIEKNEAAGLAMLAK